MVEVKTSEIHGLKVSLNLSILRDVQVWRVKLNNDIIAGKGISFAETLRVYDTVKHSLYTIARDIWEYSECENCETLVPTTTKMQVWFDSEEGKRDSWDPKLCPDCVEQLREQGNLKK